MKRTTCVAAALLGASAFLMGGCEREIARTSETDIRRDGTVRTEEKVVTETPQGGVRVEERERVDRPPIDD
jgi:hypothetical protein